MGIVNATPDSFSDGNDRETPLDKALRLADEGADIIVDRIYFIIGKII